MIFYGVEENPERVFQAAIHRCCQVLFQNDCGDWQDEMYRKEGVCPPFHCSPNQYQCLAADLSKGNVCLHPSKICNGEADCPLEDDEGKNGSAVNCRMYFLVSHFYDSDYGIFRPSASYQCLKGQYKCKNSSLCISDARDCDGKRDCPSEEDEKGCGKLVLQLYMLNATIAG